MIISPTAFYIPTAFWYDAFGNHSDSELERIFGIVTHKSNSVKVRNTDKATDALNKAANVIIAANNHDLEHRQAQDVKEALR